METLKDKVVLITGGTSGFGKATAKMMTEEGARVIIASSRDNNDIKKIKNEIPCNDYFRMDVTKASEWMKVLDYIKLEYGKIDFLLNIAGGGVEIRETVDQKYEDIDHSIKLNLNSVIYGCKTFGQLMMKQKSGTIINCSSVCSKVTWPEWTVYAAAKWGVVGFSKGLYKELQPYNIRVTCISPGASSTGFQRKSGIGEMDVQLSPNDVAQVITDICKLPGHVVIEEATVWGIDQVVIPQ